MTIAISVKVNDGIVLAADSASTFLAQSSTGPIGVVNIYYNANKVFNLCKGLPIGAMTWGLGSIGNASIETLTKDLRRRFAGEDLAHADWRIDHQSYTMEEVASRFRAFMFDEFYQPAFQGVVTQQPLDIGFAVAGYSAGETSPEVFIVEVKGGVCDAPTLIHPKASSGLFWQGQPEAISRLVYGTGINLPIVLKENFGIPPDQMDRAVEVFRQRLEIPFVLSAMPLQDAIDLAEFLADLTIKFTRFTPGAPSVGGPIEIAAISKHEGFKWIQRKHYYPSPLNPEVKP